MSSTVHSNNDSLMVDVRTWIQERGRYKRGHSEGLHNLLVQQIYVLFGGQNEGR